MRNYRVAFYVDVQAQNVEDALHVARARLAELPIADLAAYGTAYEPLPEDVEQAIAETEAN